MKYWWRNIVKDYLTFSARERRGLLIMFLIIIAIFLSSRYLPVKRTSVNKNAFQKELAQLKINIDSSLSGKPGIPRDENYADYSQPKYNEFEDRFKKELFDFDPNTLDAEGWKKLGVREKTINTIHNFLAKGYRFKQAEDIKKVYGLSHQEAERFIPYINISPTKTSEDNFSTSRSAAASSANASTENKKPAIIDINAADTSAFISLPGIGSKLAVRIVNFRQKLGGFSSVAQLGETYGIPDSTFQKIKMRLECNNPALKTININTADVNELRSHPYLRWNIANAIINYRQQHGDYKSVEDIKKIDIITDELYNKIAPYLVI